jgi:thioredoxin-like negative regulator of GroEL
MRVDEAERAWLASVAKKPSYLAYRNLAVLETQRDNIEGAEKYYELAIACDGAFDDYALVSDYLELLLKLKKHENIWQIFTALPDNCKSADRIRITAAQAAAQLGNDEFLEKFFSEIHYDVREGEDTLTDIWFEKEARDAARERGIEITPESLDRLIDEAWETKKPPFEIDFRQSYSRKNRYRV